MNKKMAGYTPDIDSNDVMLLYYLLIDHIKGYVTIWLLGRSVGDLQQIILWLDL